MLVFQSIASAGFRARDHETAAGIVGVGMDFGRDSGVADVTSPFEGALCAAGAVAVPPRGGAGRASIISPEACA